MSYPPGNPLEREQVGPRVDQGRSPLMPNLEPDPMFPRPPEMMNTIAQEASGIPPAEQRLAQQPSAMPAPAPLTEEQLTSMFSNADNTGGRPRTSGGGYGWAVRSDDFNPNGFRPNESRSMQVGKYGSSPIFAATYAAPSGAIAAAVQRNAEQKKELDDAWSKLNPMEGVEDVNAPEYRDAFTRGAIGDINSYISNVRSAYGDEEGYGRLMTPGTPEYQGLRQRAADWTTVSRSINQATKSADAILEGKKTGVLYVPPMLEEKARQVRYMTGEYAGQQDVRELAKALPNLQANVQLYDQLKKDGVPEMLSRATTTEDLVQMVKPGSPLYSGPMVTYLNEKRETTRQDLVDALTDTYAMQYDDMPRDEVRYYIEALVPESFAQKVSSKAKPTGGGGGKAADQERLYVSDNTSVPANAEVVGQDILGDDVRGQSGVWSTVNLMGFTSGEGTVAKPLNYRDEYGEHFMHPERVMMIDGKPYILGKVTGMPRTAAEWARIKKETGLDEQSVFADLSEADKDPATAMQAYQRFGLLQTKLVPLDDQNRALLSASLGVNVDRLEKALAAGDAKIPDFVKSVGYTQEDWSSLTEEERRFIRRAGTMTSKAKSAGGGSGKAAKNPEMDKLESDAKIPDFVKSVGYTQEDWSSLTEEERRFIRRAGTIK